MKPIDAEAGTALFYQIGERCPKDCSIRARIDAATSHLAGAAQASEVKVVTVANPAWFVPTHLESALGIALG